MARLKAFVGHSFNEEDKPVIDTFLKYFNSLKDTGFEWDHAERAEAKELAAKVMEKMEGKNLFIGIFTKKNRQISRSDIKPCFWRSNILKAPADKFSWTTSDWVLQESGYALGKGLAVIFLNEDDINKVNGLQGNREYITFNRNNIPACFTKLNEMIISLMKSSAIEAKTEFKDIPSEDSTETEKKEETQKTISSFGRLLNAIKENNVAEEKLALMETLNEVTDSYKQIKMKGFYHWMRHREGKKDILEDLLNLSNENPDHPDPYLWIGREPLSIGV